MEHACNAMSKNYPIVIPFPAFNSFLKDAVDSIGAYSLLNPEWAAISEEQGIPIPTPAAFPTNKYGEQCVLRALQACTLRTLPGVLNNVSSLAPRARSPSLAGIFG